AVSLKGWKTAEEHSQENKLKAQFDWLKATSFEKMPMICRRTEGSFFIAWKEGRHSRERRLSAVPERTLD
ncbi:MAG: hypothetical protein ACOYCB_14325, partial [Fastidiosipilaceae bacterium]